MSRIVFIFFTCYVSNICMAQNVGIGTETPTRAKLEIIGVAGSGATAALFGSGQRGISFQRNWPTIGFNQYRDAVTPGSQGKYISNGFAAIQYFDPGGGTYAFDMFPSGTANNSTPAAVRAITISANGNTSIKTTYNLATLVVARGNASLGTAVFAGPTHNTHWNYGFNEDTYIRAGANNGTLYINNIPNGKVLIGATQTRMSINRPSGAPLYTIEVYQPNGQKAFALVDALNHRWAMACNFINVQNHGTGVALDLYYNNVGKGRFRYYDGQYVVFSDISIKTDIQLLDPVLPRMNKLQPVSYEMIANNPEHKQTVGFVAQDIQPHFPQIVRTVAYKQKDGQTISNALAMDYSGFGVLAIKALQEQQEQLNALEKEKKELMERLVKLEKALEGKNNQ